MYSELSQAEQSKTQIDIFLSDPGLNVISTIGCLITDLESRESYHFHLCFNAMPYTSEKISELFSEASSSCVISHVSLLSPISLLEQQGGESLLQKYTKMFAAPPSDSCLGENCASRVDQVLQDFFPKENNRIIPFFHTVRCLCLACSAPTFICSGGCSLFLSPPCIDAPRTIMTKAQMMKNCCCISAGSRTSVLSQSEEPQSVKLKPDTESTPLRQAMIAPRKTTQ